MFWQNPTSMNVYEWSWKAHDDALGGRGRHWVPSWASARTSACAAFLGARLCWTVLQHTGALIRCKNLEHLLPRLCLGKNRVALVLGTLASERATNSSWHANSIMLLPRQQRGVSFTVTVSPTHFPHKSSIHSQVRRCTPTLTVCKSCREHSLGLKKKEKPFGFGTSWQLIVTEWWSASEQTVITLHVEEICWGFYLLSQ